MIRLFCVWNGVTVTPLPLIFTDVPLAKLIPSPAIQRSFVWPAVISTLDEPKLA
jgi:hypothetical protein